MARSLAHLDRTLGARASRGAYGTRVVRVALACVLATALFTLLDIASSHSFGGNSDGATVILEGQSISRGNLLLHGWSLSLDSFWSVDAVSYAVVVRIAGVSRELLHLVPAIIALCIIGLGVFASREHRRGVPEVIGALVVVAVLGLPRPVLAFFFLQGAWHVDTALYCLVAFVCLARRRLGWVWLVGVAALTAGLLGDAQTIALSVIPVFLAGVVAMVRRRSWLAGTACVLASVSATGLALLARVLTVRVGTFKITTDFLHADRSQLTPNVTRLVDWGAGLLGIGHVPIGPASALSTDDVSNGSFVGWLIHIPVLVLVVGVFVLAVGTMVAAMTARQPPSDINESWRLDDLLVLGAGGSLVVFVALCPDGNGDWARYLTAGVIFAAVLAARWAGRLSEKISAVRLRWGLLIGVCALTAACAVTSCVDFDSDPAPQPAAQLASFLLGHDLRNGVGDYWSSSLITVETGGKVAIRPVVVFPATGRLTRYTRESSAAWYANKTFHFLVYDTARPWNDVNATTATATFGRPRHIYVVGTYRVLTWKRPFVVSHVGYTPPS